MSNILNFILSHIFRLDNYGYSLERYILSHNPKNSGDVERLEREYSEKLIKGFLKWKK